MKLHHSTNISLVRLGLEFALVGFATFMLQQTIGLSLRGFVMTIAFWAASLIYFATRPNNADEPSTNITIPILTIRFVLIISTILFDWGKIAFTLSLFNVAYFAFFVSQNLPSKTRSP